MCVHLSWKYLWLVCRCSIYSTVQNPLAAWKKCIYCYWTTKKESNSKEEAIENSLNFLSLSKGQAKNCILDWVVFTSPTLCNITPLVSCFLAFLSDTVCILDVTTSQALRGFAPPSHSAHSITLPSLTWCLCLLCRVQVREKVARAPSSSRWGSSMELATQTKIREASFDLFTKTSSPPCRPWFVPLRTSRSPTNMNRIG